MSRSSFSPFIAASVAGTSASPVRLVSSGLDRILLSACWQQKRREARRQGRLQSLLMVVDSRRIALQQDQAFAKKRDAVLNGAATLVTQLPPIFVEVTASPWGASCARKQLWIFSSSPCPVRRQEREAAVITA